VAVDFHLMKWIPINEGVRRPNRSPRIHSSPSPIYPTSGGLERRGGVHFSERKSPLRPASAVWRKEGGRREAVSHVVKRSGDTLLPSHWKCGRLCFDRRVFVCVRACYSHKSKSIKPNRMKFCGIIGYYPGTIWLDFGIDRVKGQCHEKVKIFFLP